MIHVPVPVGHVAVHAQIWTLLRAIVNKNTRGAQLAANNDIIKAVVIDISRDACYGAKRVTGGVAFRQPVRVVRVARRALVYAALRPVPKEHSPFICGGIVVLRGGNKHVVIPIIVHIAGTSQE